MSEAPRRRPAGAGCRRAAASYQKKKSKYQERKRKKNPKISKPGVLMSSEERLYKKPEKVKPCLSAIAYLQWSCMETRGFC